MGLAQIRTTDAACYPPAVPRRLAYPVIAALLAVGAPLGLVAVRSVSARETDLGALARSVRQDLPTFIYVTVSTLAVFSAFGYVLGRQADALLDLARTDPLTGLHNQGAFEERLGEEVTRAARYRLPLSLIMADVDGLKAINDRAGHAAGSAALQAVAEAVRQAARQTDLACRVGGDEFAVITPSTDRADAFALAERIRSRVAADGARGGVTVSIGVASLDPERPATAALTAEADAALYDAKRGGRNRVATRGGAPPA